MAKQFTPIKEVRENHDQLVREHTRERLQLLINGAVHVDESSVRVGGLVEEIDETMKKELKAAGYSFNRSKQTISW